MNESIVFIQTPDNTWIVYDSGPEIVLYARYRTKSAPGPLALVVFAPDGWPSGIYRRAWS